MFTGLVQQKGTVRDVVRGSRDAVLHVAAQWAELEPGESISVDGVCLTVRRATPDGFEADASTETLARTALGERSRGDGVHLERALRLTDCVGGHLVTGHVDGVGQLVERVPVGESEQAVFEVPEELAPFVAPKGAVAIDGVSLTVNAVHGARFDVMLIPHTRRETTFDERPVGCRVNVEADVLAKYVARLLGKPGVDGSGGQGGVDLDLLRRHGYV